MNHNLMFTLLIIVFILNVFIKVFKVQVPKDFQSVTLMLALGAICLYYKLYICLLVYLYQVVISLVRQLANKKLFNFLLITLTSATYIITYHYDKYWVLLVAYILAMLLSDILFKDTNLGLLFGVSSLGFMLMYHRVKGAVALQYFYIIMLSIAFLIVTHRLFTGYKKGNKD